MPKGGKGRGRGKDQREKETEKSRDGPGARGRGRGRGAPPGQAAPVGLTEAVEGATGGAQAAGGHAVGLPTSVPLPKKSAPPRVSQPVEISKEHKEPAQEPGASIEKIETGFRFLSFGDSVKRAPLPRRPNFGTQGRKIGLIANHYPMEIPSGLVYHYDVTIETVQKSSGAEKMSGKKKYRCLNTKKNREVIDTMLKAYDVFRNFHPAYDGQKNLITRRPLPSEPLRLTVTLDDDGRPDTFEVNIKAVQKQDTNTCAISLDPLHELFAGKTSYVPPEAVSALEIILRHGPALRLVPIGRSFFSPPEEVCSLGAGREIWFGYHQSIQLGQWKPMVNIDTTATAFYESLPVLEFMCNTLRIEYEQLARIRNLRDSDILALSKELKQLRVEVTHMNYPRKYRVMKVTREPANRLTFTLQEGDVTRNITVADYFQHQYKRKLQYPNLPCVQAGSEAKKVYLPLEVCKIVKGQHCKKKLTEDQTSSMIKYTAVPPKERFRKIADIMKYESFNNDPCVREFGLRVSTEPLQLSGRVIAPPNVGYSEQAIMPKDGSWDMRDKKFFIGANIENWVLISFAQPRFCNYQALKKFADMLCNIGRSSGMRMPMPSDIKTYEGPFKIENVLREMKERFNAQLVVIVLSSRFSVYGEIKQFAEMQFGLITQCVKDNNVVRKCTPQLVANLCQKINAKMGGVNNSLLNTEKPLILRRPVIIIGADVSHPAPGDKIKPSIAAAVGSLDAYPSRYAVSVRVQCDRNEVKEKVEIILELGIMVKELLMAFYRNTNKKKPEKIIFYRDGVSEGQFSKVRDHEIKLLREACTSLDKDYKPPITFIVVQKRHHTRFRPSDDRNGVGRARNIPPGTTVDTDVTHPINFDFFLCSHFGIQGTSRPAHYTVLWDDNDFNADEVQKLTYYLCHIYARCTRSISIPVPVQYAHLVAFRARLHLISKTDISSRSSESESGGPLPQDIINAVKVMDEMKNTMYFV